MPKALGPVSNSVMIPFFFLNLDIWKQKFFSGHYINKINMNLFLVFHTLQELLNMRCQADSVIISDS